MKTTSTCVWFGKSEKPYEYQIFAMNTVFRDIGGNFIFCDRDVLGEWNPLYIGSSDNLFDLLCKEKLKRWIVQQGATHIHAHLRKDERQREVEKLDLVERFHPRLNHVSFQ